MTLLYFITYRRTCENHYKQPLFNHTIKINIILLLNEYFTSLPSFKSLKIKVTRKYRINKVFRNGGWIIIHKESPSNLILNKHFVILHLTTYQIIEYKITTSRANLSPAQPGASSSFPHYHYHHLKHSIEKGPIWQLKMVTRGIKLASCTKYILLKRIPW